MLPRLGMLLLAVLIWCPHSWSRLLNDDALLFNQTLFAGTHNSGISLSKHTLGRPADAEDGDWPSEATSSYQYPVMDQRLSVTPEHSRELSVISPP